MLQSLWINNQQTDRSDCSGVVWPKNRWLVLPMTACQQVSIKCRPVVIFGFCLGVFLIHWRPDSLYLCNLCVNFFQCSLTYFLLSPQTLQKDWNNLIFDWLIQWMIHWLHDAWDLTFFGSELSLFLAPNSSREK